MLALVYSKNGFDDTKDVECIKIKWEEAVDNWQGFGEQQLIHIMSQ